MPVCGIVNRRLCSVSLDAISLYLALICVITAIINYISKPLVGGVNQREALVKTTVLVVINFTKSTVFVGADF